MQRQRELRNRARERQARTLPTLKAALRDARRTHTRRLKEARERCSMAITDHRREVASERAALRAWADETRNKALAVCRLLKTNLRADELSDVDLALRELDDQRRQIDELRERVMRLGDLRDQRAGLPRHDSMERAYDEVRRNIGDDPVIMMAFERVKHVLRPVQGKTLTEVFYEYIRSKPEALASTIAKLEQQWTLKAEHLIERLSRIPAEQDQLRRYMADLDAAERHLEELGDYRSELRMAAMPSL